MALLTLGTTSTTVLRGLLVSGNMNATDLAAFNNGIKKQNALGMIEPTAYNQGVLFLPGGRGAVTCRPGDYIAYDPTTGWPIVISSFASSGGGYVHS